MHATTSIDYGWRLRGAPIALHRERTIVLRELPTDHLPVLREYAPEAIASCLQCGVCTASCGLAKEAEFPRRQVALAQLGQRQRLIQNRQAWHCYGCGDCSARCPNGAEPSQVLAAVRRIAIEEAAVPRALAQAAARPAGLLLVLGGAALAVLLAIALGGSFAPPFTHVHYASFVPHPVILVLFGGALAFAIGATGVGAARVLRASQRGPALPWAPLALARAFATALGDVATHRKHADCAAERPRAAAHFALVYGFLGLAVLAGVAALALATGAAYPFSALHPLKVLGNGCAVALLAGSGYFLLRRGQRPLFEAAPTWALFGLGLSGVMLEVARYANLPHVAYPTYFVHLVLVLATFVLLPYGKLAHAVYRVAVLTADAYAAALTTGPRPRVAAASRTAARPLTVTAEAS